MSNFSYDIMQTIEFFNGSPVQINIIKIIAVNAFVFSEQSSIPFVKVIDNSSSIDSFSSRITGNKKEIHGFFTTDSFSIFSGNVSLEFGFSNLVIDEFENIDINNGVSVLDPIYAGLSAPLGDNAWLASLNL